MSDPNYNRREAGRTMADMFQADASSTEIAATIETMKELKERFASPEAAQAFIDRLREHLNIRLQDMTEEL